MAARCLIAAGFSSAQTKPLNVPWKRVLKSVRTSVHTRPPQENRRAAASMTKSPRAKPVAPVQTTEETRAIAAVHADTLEETRRILREGAPMAARCLIAAAEAGEWQAASAVLKYCGVQPPKDAPATPAAPTVAIQIVMSEQQRLEWARRGTR
jgi:hypothetical protein